MVKIGDTFVDIEEGLNAGMWTIGVADTGNLMGLTERDLNALDEKEFKEKHENICEQMVEAGAHYVAGSVADCIRIIEEISTLLSSGERP